MNPDQSSDQSLRLPNLEKLSQPPLRDPSNDILQVHAHSLDSLLRPNSVAVIGATDRPGSVGNSILSNLAQGSFKGKVYPVNPKHGELLGLKAYPKIMDVPVKPDLAVIVTAAPTVPDLVSQCVQAGVKSAIVISAGFRETGPKGAELERQISERIKGTGLRVLGPNCLGVMNPLIGLNASFATQNALPGSVAFLSQSGALCTAILEWSLESKVGFSAFVSTGSMLDLGWGDLIDYLGSDPHTNSILLYMESVGEAQSFISAAREVAFTKPIIVLKAGSSPAAAKAAVSHTGSLAGSHEVLKAAFRRCGVLWVDGIEDLFLMASVLAKQPRPKGPRLTILTNAGGPGVLATDSLEAGSGKLTELSPSILESLNQVLPSNWSRGNPVDVLGDADPSRYDKAMEIALKDPDCDGLLAIVTPQAMTDPAQVVEMLKTRGRVPSKPVLACLMGGKEMGALRDILQEGSIPAFAYPDAAARIFNYMWHYNSNLKLLYETPELTSEDLAAGSREKAASLLLKVRLEGRTILTEYESKQVLACYGIPVTPTLLAKTEEEAVEASGKTGFPVVLKLNSLTITHKSDVGGVQLNLQGPEDVRAAFQKIKAKVTEKAGADHFQGVTVQPMAKMEGPELILGSSPDPQFGPVILFGLGGTLVEVFKDSSLALPPLTTTLARRLMERTKVYKALQGVRGQGPVDLGALERILVQFSRLVVEQPIIREIDLNPLVASAKGALALDARVVLNGLDLEETVWPRPVIRPYPLQYVTSFAMKNGAEVSIRPIRPEDETLMVKFHEGLSEQSIYMRYFQSMNLEQRVAHNRLVRLCFIDYRRQMAVVADRKGNAEEGHQVLGIGRLSRCLNESEMEFSVLIGDAWQRQGLGSEILSRLVVIGRAEGAKKIVGYILPENHVMQSIARKLGFALRPSEKTKLIEAEISI